VKRLLVIQTDDAYFLFETLRVIEDGMSNLKDYELTVLADAAALSTLTRDAVPLVRGITTDAAAVAACTYDLSANLSLNEPSWDFHRTVTSQHKLGAWRQNEELHALDPWTAYLLTLKAKAPFLTFHLRDIYRNILNLRVQLPKSSARLPIREIAFGTTAAQLFPVQEQENFLGELAGSFPGIPLRDLSEVDLLEDVSRSLYVGPASVAALKFCEAGGRGIFLASGFQGFNLLPYSGDHILVSTRGSVMRAGALIGIVDSLVNNREFSDSPYALYDISHDLGCAHLVCHGTADDAFPIYQSHLVLWNFLLGLIDVDLEVHKCTAGQLALVKLQLEVLNKFLRLHDYAIASVEAVHAEARAVSADPVALESHLKNLREVEKISNEIAATHPFLRPFLDFYRIRRGQNFGDTLVEQSQASFLTYAEEHQALKALQELFSVTLRRNEANI
jgi:hypothetical protein